MVQGGVYISLLRKVLGNSGCSLPGFPLILLFGLVYADVALAVLSELPINLEEQLLSESMPTAFSPNDFEVEDFALEWDGPPIPGIKISLEKNSLQWVRVQDVLLLPRARLLVEAENVEGGAIFHARFTQPLEGAKAVMPIALISRGRTPIEIVIVRGGHEIHGRVQVRFRPRPRVDTTEPRVYFDASCSPYRAKGDALRFTGDQWAYIGCRIVSQNSETYRAPVLEIYVFWDNVGQVIKIEGVETKSELSSLWPLKTRAFLYSVPGSFTLSQCAGQGAGPYADKEQSAGGALAKSRDNGSTLTVHYMLPEILHRGSVSLGIGPYSFSFFGNNSDASEITLIPTLYASYLFTETMRIVTFGALTMTSQNILDLGVYYSTESIRSLDRRFGFYLLLGGHAIGFGSQGQYHFVTGAPQGMEIQLTDIRRKGSNVSLGGFFYPEISGIAYYNLWFRWGSSALFFETNYIAWKENLDGIAFSYRSLGFTIGFPIPMLRFL